MQNLKELVEKGEKLRNDLGKNQRGKALDNLNNEVLIWKNQCSLYIGGLKIDKFTQGRIYTAIANLNLNYLSTINMKYFDELLNFMKACLSQETSSTSSSRNEHSPKSNRVFIVHGHNKALRDEVKSVLLELGLRPVILSEQVNGGKTIIEKFEKNSESVNYAIVLITADDEGKSKKATEYKLRARQNVILEMGYFMSRLKRSNVFLLLEDDIELPSDINGVVYASVHDNWKFMLVKELKNCGYQVSADDLN